MFEPGAKMSTRSPKLENHDRLSCSLIDATTVMLSADAGENHLTSDY